MSTLSARKLLQKKNQFTHDGNIWNEPTYFRVDRPLGIRVLVCDEGALLENRRLSARRALHAEVDLDALLLLVPGVILNAVHHALLEGRAFGRRDVPAPHEPLELRCGGGGSDDGGGWGGDGSGGGIDTRNMRRGGVAAESGGRLQGRRLPRWAWRPPLGCA